MCLDHQVKYLYAFGSSITDRFDPIYSDLDFLVEIELIELFTKDIDSFETYIADLKTQHIKHFIYKQIGILKSNA